MAMDTARSETPSDSTIGEVIDASFPASDPPAYGGVTAGPPAHLTEGAPTARARRYGLPIAIVAGIGSALAWLALRRRNRG